MKVDAQLNRLPGQVRSRTIASSKKEGPGQLAMPSSNYLGTVEKYDKNIAEEVKDVIVAYDTARTNRDVAVTNMKIKMSSHSIDKIAGKHLKTYMDAVDNITQENLNDAKNSKEVLLQKFKKDLKAGVDRWSQDNLDLKDAGDAYLTLNMLAFITKGLDYYDLHEQGQLAVLVDEEVQSTYKDLQNRTHITYPAPNSKIPIDKWKIHLPELKKDWLRQQDNAKQVEIPSFIFGEDTVLTDDLYEFFLAEHFMSSYKADYMDDQGFVAYAKMVEKLVSPLLADQKYSPKEKEYIKNRLKIEIERQEKMKQTFNGNLLMEFVQVWATKDKKKKNAALLHISENYIRGVGSPEAWKKAITNLTFYIDTTEVTKFNIDSEKQKELKINFYLQHIDLFQPTLVGDETKPKSIWQRYLEEDGTVDASFIVDIFKFMSGDKKIQNSLLYLNEQVDILANKDSFKKGITGEGYFYNQSPYMQDAKHDHVIRIIRRKILDLIFEPDINASEARKIVDEQLNFANTDSVIYKTTIEWQQNRENRQKSLHQMINDKKGISSKRDNKKTVVLFDSSGDIYLKDADGKPYKATDDDKTDLIKYYRESTDKEAAERAMIELSGKRDILTLLGIVKS